MIRMPTISGRTLTIIKILISVLLLTLLFTWINTDQVLDLMAHADVGLLAVAALCLIGQTAIASLKWYVLLKGQGATSTYATTLRILFISRFINLFAPGTVGGDAYRVVSIRSHTKALRGALTSVIVDRGSGIVVLAAIGIAGVSQIYFPDYAMEIIGAYLALVIVGYLLAIGPIRSFVYRFDRDAFYRVAGLLQQVTDAIQPSWRLLAVFGISTVFQLNIVWISWIYAQATAITVNLAQLFIIIPATYMVELIPITISGIGLREGTMAVLFQQMGLVASHGVVLGLTISIMRYVSGIVGGLILAWEAIARRRPRHRSKLQERSEKPV